MHSLNYMHCNCLQVWCVRTGLLLVTARGHTGEISDLSLSADGSMVASGATDADVRVWSLQVNLIIMAVE
jgi:WD40 repeat protein